MNNRDILVIAEHKEGAVTSGTLEAIGAGRYISGRLNTGLSVIALGSGISALSSAASNIDTDNIYLIENHLLTQYTSDAHLAAIYPFIKSNKPSIILIPSTCLGRDLAPKLAARLKTAYLSDVSEIKVDSSEILFTRQVYGGRLLSTVKCRGEMPWVITLRSRAFEKPAAPASKPPKVESFPVDIDPSYIRTIIKNIEKTQKGLGLTDADIIISGGRGMKGAEGFKMLEELAGILGGVVGASGAAVDAGWMPHSAQVGQTGKVVSPKLYIACGISGAPQHLAGMSTSKCIVAINKDPEAPIFKTADYGITGDIFEVLPILIDELKR
ncbi:MAG: electron transfer flavoprotein subunit alpha/FixB family protein [Deltaproteobacteria bacterium]|nr:electron transfer flavoprotein subunit alpha/FixB family protein [Deltaproteobacteria bacterium]